MVATVGSIRALFEADMRGYVAGLQKGERATSTAAARMNRHVRSTQTSIGALNAGAGALAGTLTRTLAPALGGLGLASLARHTRSVVSELSKLGKTADKVGVQVEDLQRLRFGMELSGVAINTTDMALQRFSRRVAEAANGSGELRKVLEANNIQLRDGDGNMRSQVDILRDYADLIKNAGSQQERLLLAFKAFDSEGAAFVVGLRNGADGLDTLMSKADEAGGVIEERLVRKAEEIDDEFAIVWRNFELNAKRSVIQVVAALRPLDAWAQDFLSKLPVVAITKRLLGEDASSIDQVTAKLGNLNRQLETLQERRELNIELAMPTDEVDANIEAVKAQIAALQKQLAALNGEASRGYVVGTPGDPNALARSPWRPPSKPTVIPGNGSGGGSDRNKAAEEALRQAEAVAALIDQLQFEQELIGATDVERRQAEALRQAGSAATEEQRQAIKRLIREIHRETEALEANKQAQEDRRRAIEDLFGMGEDALLAMLDNAQDAEDAIKRLAIQLAAAAAQAALLGSGPLAGLFGGSLFGGGGGGFTDFEHVFASGFAGLFHKGGDADNPKAFQSIAAALPRYHSGAGIKHNEVMALLEKNESVFTGGQTARIANALEASTSSLKDGGRLHVTFGMASDGALNIMPEVREVSRQEAGSAVRTGLGEYDQKVLPERLEQIRNDPRAR